jgi:hypothetical protein
MWDQTNANYITDQGLLKCDITRWLFAGDLRASTCRLEFLDPTEAVRLGKPSSSLYPNVQLGRRVRVLVQTGPGTGVWEPHFFGYISNIEPDTTNMKPSRTTLTAVSPLDVLADLDVTLPPSDHPLVYSAADPDHSALWLLLAAAGLWDTDLIDLYDVGAVEIPAVWGNGTKKFTEWLGELVGYAGTVACAEPRYATASGQPDWVLRWLRPGPAAAADFHWDAADGELEPTAQLVYNGIAP